ncbi:MAG TPA: glycosyltransferase [Candidatus Krumholzibacteria bacterium]|nr:glycosyltransferase [Candidatus Krumholzibacteria bacterium]
MQKNSLSLCMIVKDAEDTVGRAIKSALAVVDEVVVVDTGSTDNTRLIVEGYGARVIDHHWHDDFSAARNAGLSAAYGDWILILDADEVLETIRPVEIGRLLADEDAVAYYARLRDESSGRGSTVHDKVRLFRNHPDIRFRYPIHEQVTPSIAQIAQRTGGEFLPSPLSIVHYGSPDDDDKSTRARNQRLLHRAIDQYPDEPYFRYRLACEIAVHLEEKVLPVKGFRQMMSELQAAITQVRGFDERRRAHVGYGPDLYARTAAAELADGRPLDALDTCAEGLDRFGEGSLLRFTQGRALLAAAEVQPGEAADEFRAAGAARMHLMLERDASLEPAPIGNAYFEVYPHRYLGAAALAAGEIVEARDHFRTALSNDPDYTGALCGLARVAEAEGRVRDALQVYLKALSINEDEIDAWIGGAEVLIGLGFDDNARSWLQKLSNSVPEEPRVEQLLTRIEGVPAVSRA